MLPNDLQNENCLIGKVEAGEPGEPLDWGHLGTPCLLHLRALSPQKCSHDIAYWDKVLPWDFIF
jgi:hypothetical protein